MDQAATGWAALGLDPQEPLLLYCKKGVRASRAANALAEQGFRKLRVLHPAGFAELQAAGLAAASATP